MKLSVLILLVLVLQTCGLRAQDGGAYIWQDEEWVWVDEVKDGDIVYEEEDYNETNDSNSDWNLQDSLKKQYQNRVFRKKWKSKYTGTLFDYTDKKVEYKPTDIKKPNWDLSGLFRLLSALAKIIGYALIVLVIFLLLRAVFTDSGIAITGFRRKKPDYDVKEDKEVNIEDDWLKKAIDARNRGDLKLAVRYYFLAYLKQLHLEKNIDFHKDKSNREYRYEIIDQNIRNEFDVLSRVFDYCWYGDFEITQEQFSRVESIFSKHLKS